MDTSTRKESLERGKRARCGASSLTNRADGITVPVHTCNIEDEDALGADKRLRQVDPEPFERLFADLAFLIVRPAE